MIMDTRIESLVKSLERNHHRYKETFIDEDTGKEEEIDRDEIVAEDRAEDDLISVRRTWKYSRLIRYGSGLAIMTNSIWN